MSKDRTIDELARIEFTGSMGEAIGRYSRQLRGIARRWDTELGLASTDVRAALVSMRGPRRVARRLRRAQTLAAGLHARAEQFTTQYGKQFLALTAAQAKQQARQPIEGDRK